MVDSTLLKNTPETNLEAYTLGVIEKLVKLGVSEFTVYKLFKHLMEIKDPNKRKEFLDSISKLANKYRDPLESRPEVLDVVIEEFIESVNPDKFVEVVLRDNVRNVLVSTYYTAKNSLGRASRTREAVKNAISLFYRFPEDTGYVILNIATSARRLMLLSSVGKEIIESLINAEKRGLLEKNEALKYTGRIAGVIEKIKEVVYDSSTPISERLINTLSVQLREIIDTIVFSKNSSPKEMREKLDEILRNFEEMYSDENLEGLRKLRNKGLLESILDGLKHVEDPLTFRELIKLLNKNAFEMMIQSLQSYGDWAISGAIENIAHILRMEVRTRGYLERCLKSHDRNSCRIVKSFYGKVLDSIPQRFIIEEAVEELVNTFANQPYFSDILYVVIASRGLEELKLGEIKPYIEVITSLPSIQLFKSLYNQKNWIRSIEDIRKYILPSIRLIIKEFGEDGIKIANRYIGIIKDYVSLDSKSQEYFTNILSYSYEILKDVVHNRENLEKFINLLDTLNNYIIDKGMRKEIALVVLKSVYDSFEDYRYLRNRDPEKYYEVIRKGHSANKISKTLDYYLKPEVIENLARGHLGSYS